MRFVLLSVILSFSQILFAHDGHGTLPGSVAAPHGGKILSLPELYIEILKSGNSISVYPLTHDLKPIPLSEIDFSVDAELPKQKKAVPSITPSDSFWKVTLDAKGAHRVSYFFKLDWKGKKGSAKFTNEQ